jgi:hypothetical protein
MRSNTILDKRMNSQCVADFEGPWVEPEFDSGLIARCRAYWTVPVSELPNSILATFLRQRMAMSLVVAEAQSRIEAHVNDESEMFDGELLDALKEAR